MIAKSIHTILRFTRRCSIAGAVTLGIAVGTTGCGTSRPTLSEARYDGPSIQVDRSGKLYRLTFQAPSQGWTFTLDQVQPSLDKATLLVTARKPDPSYMYAQVIVDQQLLTQVETTTPIDVYARVAEFISSAKSTTYDFVASSTP